MMKFKGIKISDGYIEKNIPYSTIKEYEDSTLNSLYGYKVVEEIEELYNCEVLSVSELSILFNWRNKISKEGKNYWGDKFLTKEELKKELQNNNLVLHGIGDLS